MYALMSVTDRVAVGWISMILVLISVNGRSCVPSPIASALGVSIDNESNQVT